MLERGCQGTYHKMLGRQLGLYVDEFFGHHNGRDVLLVPPLMNLSAIRRFHQVP